MNEDVKILGIVESCGYLRIRKEPNKESDVVAIIPVGTMVELVNNEVIDGFYAVHTENGDGYCMADRRTEYWFCIIQRDCGAGDQLSVCARTCNTGSNYGRKWNGSQKWYYVQDSSFTGRDWKDADCLSLIHI